MRSGHDSRRRYSPHSGLVRQPELDGLPTEGTAFINQPRASAETRKERS